MTKALLIAALAMFASPAAAYDIVTIDQLEAYAPAEIHGTVDRVTDEDTFVLRDETGTIPVYIGPHRVPVGAGANVIVFGRLDDDRPREVYADRLTLPDGETIQVGGPYE